jgi:hypothetical protein
MEFINKIKNTRPYKVAESFFLGNASYTDLNKMRALGKNPIAQMPSSIITHQSKMMRVESLASWKTAVMLATNPENPNKLNLQLLYENMETDNHLGSVMETRISKTQQSPFKLVKNKVRDEEAEELFKTLWFQEFIKLILESKFKGTKLIELFKLNELGALAEIKEIDQANFNPLKGIIQKEPGDEKGIAYKEGPMMDFYIQAGKDYKDLGTWLLIVPIVLAKKLGLGSWLDFIEKYGVPPLFVTTEREDDERLLELFEMATNFKANNFMIGRGNEKFEIPNITTSGSENAFDGIIKRADNEISKRFLGGTGLTDEKGFVGSVEIQFEFAQFRFAADKLLVAYYVNEYLIPKLQKISPYYSMLKDLRFEWDDEEEMTIDKLCSIIERLGSYFDFDPEQVEQITGLKVLGVKQNTATPPPTEAKKKMT